MVLWLQGHKSFSYIHAGSMMPFLNLLSCPKNLYFPGYGYSLVSPQKPHEAPKNLCDWGSWGL